MIDVFRIFCSLLSVIAMVASFFDDRAGRDPTFSMGMAILLHLISTP